MESAAWRSRFFCHADMDCHDASRSGLRQQDEKWTGVPHISRQRDQAASQWTLPMLAALLRQAG